MKKTKKILALIFAAAMAAASLAGCGSGASASVRTLDAEARAALASAASSSVDGTKEYTDSEGNIITLEGDVDSVAITSWKGAFEQLILLGKLDIVTCMSETAGRYEWLRYVYPEIKDIPNYGSFNDISIEEIVALSPDVVISPAAASEANEQLRELGLTVYVNGVSSGDDPYEGFYVDLKNLSEIFGAEDVAEAYQKWEDEVFNMVEERIADIPEEERKTALVMRNSTTEVFNNRNILGEVFEMAGVENVAADAFSDNFYAEVSAEDILTWDPDYIFSYIVGASGEELEGRYNELKDDPRFAELTAVENGDCYIMPHGLTNWGGKIETALGVAAIAKTVYPELFEDVNLYELADDFYTTFLGVELGEDDFEYLFFNCEGANELNLGDTAVLETAS